MVATIAIVDDDEAVLDSTRLLLESERWSPRLYAKGGQFLADLRARMRPNCVILDPHLPDISGDKVVRSVSSMLWQLPIIVWTAEPNSLRTTEVLQAGIHVILIKPVAAEVLLNEIQTAIGGNRNPS